MPPKGIVITIKTKGPILTGMAAQRVIPDLIHPTIQDVMDVTQQRLAERLKPRPGGAFLSVAQAQKGKASTGHYAKHILGTFKTQTLARVSDQGYIYVPWLEGTSNRNQSTRFKGYGTFRKAKLLVKKRVPELLAKRIAAFTAKYG